MEVMRLRLVRERRLKPARRRFGTQAIPAMDSVAERDCGEAVSQSRAIAPFAGHGDLYDAIERTQAFLHKQVRRDGILSGLRCRYPSPQFFIESNRRAMERAGLNRLDAFYYAMIPALTRTTMSQQWGESPKLDAFYRMGEYVKNLYVGLHVECFYLVMLDRRGRLIRPVLLQRGAVDSAPFYLGQLLNASIQEDARFLVLAHNHPCGTRRPSREDVACTLRTLEAFTPLKLPLLDHLIVAGDEVVSIRQTGLVPDMLWYAALPGSRIVMRWLDEKLNNS